MDLLQKAFRSRSEGGQIQLILGPMFSGKSTELMRRIKRYQVATRKCLAIKYAKDKRYSDCDLAAHDGQTIAAIQAEELQRLLNVADDFDGILGICITGGCHYVYIASAQPKKWRFWSIFNFHIILRGALISSVTNVFDHGDHFFDIKNLEKKIRNDEI